MQRGYATVFGVVGLLAAATQIQSQTPVAGYTASQEGELILVETWVPHTNVCTI